MNIDNYQYLSTEELMENEYFRQGVFHPDESTAAFWLQFLEEFPAKKETLEEAKSLLLAIHGHYEEAVQQVPQKQAMDSYKQVAKRIKPKRSWITWAAAASILLILGMGSLFLVQEDSSKLSFTTGNGKRQALELPDGSKVQLNANSTLYFYKDKWTDAQNREVWLEGEAFFSVTKKAAGTKFLVHAADMEVAVLGTEFNVRARGTDGEVVLTEGKVALKVEEQTISMLPGDLVSYSKLNHEVASKKVKTADYIAWKDGITVFNNTLEEVVKELEILYGVSFRIEKEALKTRQVQLSVPTDSFKEVLQTLELLYPEEISIREEADAVIIF